MNVLNKYIFGILCLSSLGLYSCDKDENSNPDSTTFATGTVELPALRNGANDVFISHSTLYKGQSVVTYSMEYDKSKKHARWIAFKYYNQTAQTTWNRNDWKQTEWGGRSLAVRSESSG